MGNRRKKWNTEVGTKDMNVFNLESNRSKTVQVQGFPRLKPISQIGWEKFYASIVETNNRRILSREKYQRRIN